MRTQIMRLKPIDLMLSPVNVLQIFVELFETVGVRNYYFPSMWKTAFVS